MKIKMPFYLSVYNTVLFNILIGEYKQGDKLPSRQELSQRLRTSEITVRKALRMLAEQGYIDTKRGRVPIVKLDINDPQVQNTIQMLMGSRNNIIVDILNSYRFIMPTFVYLGLSNLKKSELQQMKEQLTVLIQLRGHKFYDGFYKAIEEILKKSGNENILYFYSGTHFYLRFLTHMLKQEKLDQMCSRLVQLVIDELDGFQKLGVAHKKEQVIKQTETLIHFITDNLNFIQNTDFNEKQGMNLLFYHIEPKYMKIAFDLMEKINEGYYQINDFLPSDLAAAKEYHVATMTVRKAYKLLQEIGYLQSIPSVGTKVVFGNQTICSAKNKYLKIYLDCLQFMLLSMKGLMVDAENFFDETLSIALEEKEQRYQTRQGIYKVHFLLDFIKLIVDYTRCETVKGHYKIMEPFLFIGIYLLRETLESAEQPIFASCHEASQYLKQGERQQFETCFLNLLNYVYDLCQAEN